MFLVVKFDINNDLFFIIKMTAYLHDVIIYDLYLKAGWNLVDD